MSSVRRGFTLVELLVVVLILGVLASVGGPAYFKTIETSKATDAVGMLQMVAGARRMCGIDNPSSPATCSLNYLQSRNYMSGHDWNGAPYTYATCPGGSCCGGTAVACADRKTGTYTNWGYRIDNNGACSPVGGAPACPGLQSGGGGGGPPTW